MEKSYKVLETKLKMYTAVSPNFDFEKIKFKVLHHIQEDFMPRSQIRLTCSKVFKANQSVKGNKCFFYIKEVAANVLLKLKYL